MANFKVSKIIIFVFILAAGFAAAALYSINNNKSPDVLNYNDRAKPPASNVPPKNNPEPKPPVVKIASSTPPLPNTLNLPIPFTAQAPTGNWDQLHNEACEEAGAIMVAEYFKGNKNIQLDPELVEGQISSLTLWQDQHFGYHLDTTAEETAQMIRGYYGLEAKVVSNYTLQNIKDELNSHHAVILPVNGRQIGNPNYKQPGPIYHMLVIRGYSDAALGVGAPTGASEHSTILITNDSGTRKGQNYPYTFETLYNAAADWDHNTNTIDQNKKVMIVVWK